MQLELTDDEATALRRLLDESLKELSGEIADTDNMAFRKGLMAYRDNLRAVQGRL